MFRLGRHHARLTRWHKDHVGADSVAVNVPHNRGEHNAHGRRRVAAHRNVAVGRARVMPHESRTARSHSAVSRSRVARPFARC